MSVISVQITLFYIRTNIVLDEDSLYQAVMTKVSDLTLMTLKIATEVRVNGHKFSPRAPESSRAPPALSL